MPQESHSTSDANASSDPVDDIASLLMGGDIDDDTGTEDDSPTHEDQTPDDDDVEDLEDAEEPSEESTEDDDDDEEPEEDTEDEDQPLAKMLGVEEDQLSVSDDGDFKINLKVDGQQGQVSLGELIKGYQNESSNTHKSTALATERKQFETAVAAKAQELQNALQYNQNMAKVLEQEIMADYEKVDWEDLRQYDPAEWSARRQEFSTKYTRIQRMQQEIGTQATQAQQATQSELGQKRQDYMKGQWDRMIENNPSWSDQAKYTKDMNTLKGFVSETYGFGDGDFDNVSDARIIEVLKDAQKYRLGSKVAEKKVKKVPKMQKRGKGGRYVKNKVSALDKLTKAARNAKGADKRQLQTDAVAELLTGGL